MSFALDAATASRPRGFALTAPGTSGPRPERPIEIMNELEHSGLRADGERVLGRLFRRGPAGA